MKQFLKDYFTFSKKERIAVFILLLLIGIAIALPYFFSKEKPFPKENATLTSVMNTINANQLQNDSVNAVQLSQPIADNTLPEQKNNLFFFDPNMIDADGWKKLGVREKTIRTILNYRSKGGKFIVATDIRKIWGLKKEEADRLIPFIQIQNNIAVKQYNKTYPALKNSEPLEINTATPQQLRQFLADASLAYRIVNYRNKLGGFIGLTQIKETYGITDSLYQTIQNHLTINTSAINKININQATEYQLAAHPYIKTSIAKAIIIYRNQYGNYQAVDDLKKIVFIGDDVFQKIYPYLTVQ